jgi:hypothetical protein
MGKRKLQPYSDVHMTGGGDMGISELPHSVANTSCPVKIIRCIDLTKEEFKGGRADAKTFRVRSPFKTLQACGDAINRIDYNVITEITNIVRTFFVDYLRHLYGVQEVYELGDDPVEIEGSFVVVADVRDVRWWIMRLCGASDELERKYNITADVQPQQVRFISQVSDFCTGHCSYYNGKLTLMPMTAAVMRFPSTTRIRIEPEPIWFIY